MRTASLLPAALAGVFYISRTALVAGFQSGMASFSRRGVAVSAVRGGGGGGGGGGAPRPNVGPKGSRVAIIGGGVSGLACAKRLQELGMTPVVYDTGNNAPGGRCSTRVLEDPSSARRIVFDHSAQILEAPSTGSTWADWVGQMEEQGSLREWAAVGTVRKGGSATRRPPDAPRVLVGKDGMKSMVDWLARGVRIDRPKWVSKARPNRDGGWRLWHYQDLLADFDYLVIAHNGKCAARLMKSPGETVAPIQRLLEVRFGSRLKFDPPREMQLCSLWVLLAFFPEPLDLVRPLPVEGAFVEGVPELSWISNNAAKLRQAGLEGTGGAWTIVSSPFFGEKNKVPQESIPDEKREEVTNRLLVAFERAVGVRGGGKPGQPVVRPSLTFVQLWGAGNPISVADVPAETPFLFQASTNVGVCGDWLLTPSLEGAATSGIRLAEHIKQVQEAKRGGAADGLHTVDIGLDCGFKAVAGPGAAAIGSFSAAPQAEAASAGAPKPR